MVSTTDGEGGIDGSHHDFGGGAWSDYQICKPCHTPHDANTLVNDAPLWNHAVTTANFMLYSSGTLNAIPAQPGGRSKLCLSCHDGSVAVDAYGERNGTWLITFPRALIGTDLKNDHPISITYDSALASADGELHDPVTAPSGLGNTIARDLLFNSRVECPTCHDVHVKRNTQGCVGCHDMQNGPVYKETLSLRKANDGSALCLTCHLK